MMMMMMEKKMLARSLAQHRPAPDLKAKKMPSSG